MRPNPHKEVESWNARVKLGDTVEPAITRRRFVVEHPAEVLHGHAIIWLDGTRGGVPVSLCTPVVPSNQASLVASKE